MSEPIPADDILEVLCDEPMTRSAICAALDLEPATPISAALRQLVKSQQVIEIRGRTPSYRLRAAGDTTSKLPISRKRKKPSKPKRPTRASRLEAVRKLLESGPKTTKEIVDATSASAPSARAWAHAIGAVPVGSHPARWTLPDAAAKAANAAPNSPNAAPNSPNSADVAPTTLANAAVLIEHMRLCGIRPLDMAEFEAEVRGALRSPDGAYDVECTEVPAPSSTTPITAVDVGNTITPEMIARLIERRVDQADAAQVLRGVEWGGVWRDGADEKSACPECEGIQPGQGYDGTDGHATGCRLAAVLAGHALPPHTLEAQLRDQLIGVLGGEGDTALPSLVKEAARTILHYEGLLNTLAAVANVHDETSERYEAAISRAQAALNAARKGFWPAMPTEAAVNLMAATGEKDMDAACTAACKTIERAEQQHDEHLHETLRRIRGLLDLSDDFDPSDLPAALGARLSRPISQFGAIRAICGDPGDPSDVVELVERLSRSADFYEQGMRRAMATTRRIADHIGARPNADSIIREFDDSRAGAQSLSKSAERIISTMKAVAEQTGADMDDVDSTPAAILRHIEAKDAIIRAQERDLETAERRISDLIAREHSGHTFLLDRVARMARHDARKALDGHLSRWRMADTTRSQTAFGKALQDHLFKCAKVGKTHFPTPSPDASPAAAEAEQ